MWKCEDKKIRGETILKQYDYEDTNKTTCMIALVIMMLVYRLIAAVWMWKFHTGKK